MKSNFNKIFCYFNDFEKIGREESKYYFKRSSYKQILLYAITAPLFFIFDTMSSKLKRESQKNASKERCLFTGFIPDLLVSSKKFLMPIVTTGGVRDRLYLIMNKKQYVSVNHLLMLIAIIYVIPFYKMKEMLTFVLLQNSENILRKISPKYILLLNDVSPIEKAFIFSARKFKIPVITLQHGWNSEHNKEMNYKDSDYYIVWGEHFKNMYIKKELQNPNHIFVLGYPYIISDKYKTKKSKEVKKVCFLGQPFFKINRLLFNKQIEIVNNIISVCQVLNLDFCYRLHPGENIEIMKKIFPTINFIIGARAKENMLSTINSNDIFLSINSTAIIEVAGLYKKFCIQIYEPTFSNENFEELGICYSVSNNYNNILSIIKEYISGNKPIMEFNDAIIKIPNNLGEEFYSILSKINSLEHYR